MMNELIAEAKLSLGLRSVWIDDEEYERIVIAVLAKAASFDEDDARTMAIASSARMNRLMRICQAIRWNDLGEPAMKENGTRAAMHELACFVLQDGLERSART
ncbi:hypothetical protein GR212_15495 [Rhizobium lusitanum]|uniref:Uncharacterized protein n=1 Tax=Rhizobium lusitanum TaxID=293958 RepID=A0A6L9U6S6_9HYPH|nr:hypothetical protein [Rhizobium lusitanum]NEI70984.1 hypothetical protein [Rhizobium lusitanum]